MQYELRGPRDGSKVGFSFLLSWMCSCVHCFRGNRIFIITYYSVLSTSLEGLYRYFTITYAYTNNVRLLQLQYKIEI